MSVHIVSFTDKKKTLPGLFFSRLLLIPLVPEHNDVVGAVVIIQLGLGEPMGNLVLGFFGGLGGMYQVNDAAVLNI